MGERSRLPASPSLWLISVPLCVALCLCACGKKEQGKREARIGPDTSSTYASLDSPGPLNPAAAPGGARRASTHDFDGFYIERKYYSDLKKNLSIFATRFPSASVYLQIRGDSAVMDYSNHEGGSGVLIIDSGAGPLRAPGNGIMGGGPVAIRRLNDSVVEAWENGADASSEFLEAPAGIGTIEGLYGSLLLDGLYRCADKSFCGDTVFIHGNAVSGLRGKSRLRILIDWMDNMPQMDYVEFTGAEPASLAYAVSKDKLELFAIDLPKACKSLADYDCPLTESKRGKKVLELVRIEGVREMRGREAKGHGARGPE